MLEASIVIAATLILGPIAENMILQAKAKRGVFSIR
jgi:hypothetical protein